MKFNISGRNIDVTDRIRNQVDAKLGKLEKFFSQDVEAQVTLSSAHNCQKIEVTIPVKGGIIRGEQENADLFTAIDLVEEIMETQLKKYRRKIVDRYQEGSHFSKGYIEHEDIPEETEGSEIQIVKVKHFQFKPMDPEEACMQMELLGHDFFVFTNSETDEVNVVYKRKNSTYGIIEPER